MRGTNVPSSKRSFQPPLPSWKTSAPSSTPLPGARRHAVVVVVVVVCIAVIAIVVVIMFADVVVVVAVVSVVVVSFIDIMM